MGSRAAPSCAEQEVALQDRKGRKEEARGQAVAAAAGAGGTGAGGAGAEELSQQNLQPLQEDQQPLQQGPQEQQRELKGQPLVSQFLESATHLLDIPVQGS